MHAGDLDRLGAQGGKGRQLRLQAQAHLHDLEKIGCGGGAVDLTTDEGSCALAAGDAALGLQHLQRAADRAAADAHLLGQLPFGRQAGAVRMTRIVHPSAQLFQRIGRGHVSLTPSGTVIGKGKIRHVHEANQSVIGSCCHKSAVTQAR